MLLLSFPFLYAAEGDKSFNPYLKTDLVSAYLWRGQKNAGVSIQPVAGFKYRGLDVYFWGNVQLCPPANQNDKHEIDLFIKYRLKNLTIGLKDVYVNTRGDGVFSFGSIPHSANGLDVLLGYDFGFLQAEWSTTIAGYDGYNHSGHRSYGSYLILTAPLKARWFDFSAQLGIVPYYCSRYSEDNSGGFHVNMCAVKMSHTFTFSSPHIQLTPYTQLMVNPSARTAHMTVGASFLMNP